ncbi:MAG: hypothetical protein NC093_00500 [Alistipes sp.]|nr:hypothetical protein [Alistipes sp.]
MERRTAKRGRNGSRMTGTGICKLGGRYHDHSFASQMHSRGFIFRYALSKNRLTDFFDELDEKVDFKLWFSGHYHRSGWYDKKHILIYNDIVKLTDTGIERMYPHMFEGDESHDKQYRKLGETVLEEELLK